MTQEISEFRNCSESVNTTLDNVDALVGELSASDTVYQRTACQEPVARFTLPEPTRSAKLCGYQRRSREQVQWPPEGVSGPGWQEPKPLPKRPTGRFFIGALLVIICFMTVWHIWNTFFSVVAYGVVKGDTLSIVSPWDGKIAQLHIREGQTIEKGDILATLDNTELVRKIERLHEQLSVEHAKLGAASTRFAQENQYFTAQYYQWWATLQKQRQEQVRMQADLERIQVVKELGVISNQERNHIMYSASGQNDLVDKLSSAVEELRKRADCNDTSEKQTVQLQVQPIQAQIEYLQGEIRRTLAEIQEGELRSPVTGIVVRCHAVVGQVVTRTDTMIEIVDKDSVKIELFISQNMIERFPTGMELKVSLEPFENPITCTVVGSRRRFEPAPNSIQRFYNNREALMPLILEPQHGVFARRLLVGSVTKFTLFQSLGLQ